MPQGRVGYGCHGHHQHLRIVEISEVLVCPQVPNTAHVLHTCTARPHTLDSTTPAPPHVMDTCPSLSLLMSLPQTNPCLMHMEGKPVCMCVMQPVISPISENVRVMSCDLVPCKTVNGQSRWYRWGGYGVAMGLLGQVGLTLLYNATAKEPSERDFPQI